MIIIDALHKYLYRIRLSASRRIALKTLPVIAAISLLSVGAAHAAPPPQLGHLNVRIDRITLRDGFDDQLRTAFDRGAKLIAEVEFTDLRDKDSVPENSPEYEVPYILKFTIGNSKEGTIYDSSQYPHYLKQVALAPAESAKAEIVWNVPYDFPVDDYKFRVNIGFADNPDVIEQYSERDLRIIESPRYIFRSHDKWDFGEVFDEEIPRTEQIFIAPRNPDAGDFTWRVTKWPTEWLELTEPALDPVDSSRSIEITNAGFLRLRVIKTVLFGEFTGEIVITSNAAEFKIPVTASIKRYPSGIIEGFEVSPKEVLVGDEIDFSYSVNNDGRTDLLYRVSFVVRDQFDTLIYDSGVSDEDEIFELADGETSGVRTFTWQVPSDSVSGEYKVGIRLRNAYEQDSQLYHSIETANANAGSFTVLKGSMLSVSPAEWQFGSVFGQGSQMQVATFRVANDGRPPLEWEVHSIPEWTKLETPSRRTRQLNDGIVVLRLKDDVSPGKYTGTLVIHSNGGEFSAPLAVNFVSPGVNRTPTIIPTPVLIAAHTATATNTPRPSPTPTSTQTPEPTATHTPTATNTPRPSPTPTSTQTPEPTATHTPTATNTPQPSPTAANTPTPKPAAARTATLTLTLTNIPQPSPTAANTPTPKPAAARTATLTLTPTLTNIPQPSPTAANTPLTAAVATGTPEAQPTELPPGATEKPPGGACSESPKLLSPMSSFANLATLLMPLVLIRGVKWTRSRRSGSP